MGRVREIGRLGQRVRIGAPDPALTPVSGMAAVTELVDRLGMIKLLDTAVGPIKTRDRGYTGGQLLVGVAAAWLAGQDFLVGLDRQRADVAGQVLAPVAGLSSTTAAGLARRLSEGQWQAVETGIGDIHAAMLAALPPARAAALTETVTIDLTPSTWTPPTWRSTDATSRRWPTTTRDNAAGARTWRPGPRPRRCWPPT